MEQRSDSTQQKSRKTHLKQGDSIATVAKTLSVIGDNICQQYEPRNRENIHVWWQTGISKLNEIATVLVSGWLLLQNLDKTGGKASQRKASTGDTTARRDMARQNN